MNRLMWMMLIPAWIPGSGLLAQGQTPGDIYLAHVNRAQQEYRAGLAQQIREASVVQLCLLRFDDLRESIEFELDDVEWFPVQPYETATSVISQRMLTPAESKKLLSALADQIEQPRHTGGMMCHYPVHGIRVYPGTGEDDLWKRELIYEGSFCWRCRNFAFEYPDFTSDWLDTNQQLKQLLNDLMPIPDEELSRFKEAHPQQNPDRDSGDQ